MKMEVVEVCAKTKCQPPSLCKPMNFPCVKQVKQDCLKKYIQPPRMPSCAPKKIHKSPSIPFDAKTTYHVSYINTGSYNNRVKSIRPTSILQPSKDKFQNDTTNRLSYQPIWEIVKAKPFIPRRRKLTMSGPMQSVTTAREDFGPKYVEKPETILPSGNIRFCMGPMENCTTTGLSYINPGFIKPPNSFKPIRKYSAPDDPISKETTHLLSYQPFCVQQRELYPWAQKSIYKPPEAAMNAQTTYSKSYMEISNPSRVKPIKPISCSEWLHGDRKFYGETCYSNTFIPQTTDVKCAPIIPSGNIILSNKKMASDTTNKLSYQSVCSERRKPFRPKRRNMMGNGTIESLTTNRLDYQTKIGEKPEIIIPCDNIKQSKKPLDGTTTSALSYINHGFIPPPTSCKPSGNYNKSSSKLEADTVNKLSYQPWTLPPKTIYPWAKKMDYQRPTERMVGDSIYNMSFSPPGHFITECETSNETSNLPNHHHDPTIANVCSNIHCSPNIKLQQPIMQQLNS